MTLPQSAGYLLIVVLLAGCVAYVRHACRNLPHRDPASCDHAAVDDQGVCVDCLTDVEGPVERVAVPVAADPTWQPVELLAIVARLAETAER